MCDFVDHNLKEIWRQNGGDYSPSVVVKWCVDCGAVVVDAEFDGGVYAGRYMEMQFPVIINEYRNLRKGMKK